MDLAEMRWGYALDLTELELLNFVHITSAAKHRDE